MSDPRDQRLSEDKAERYQAYSARLGYQLSAKDVGILADYYKEKRNVTIIINGDTKSDVIRQDIAATRESKQKANSERLLNMMGKNPKPTNTNSLIQEMINEIEDIGPSKEACAKEILEIKEKLKPGEIVGYVFTNGHKNAAAHFEVFIIEHDRVIKPVSWPLENTNGMLDGRDIPELYDANSFILSKIANLGPHGVAAQSKEDKKSCGTLGMLYLKELLKDDHKQLLDNSLCASLYYNGEKANLFIPSANVLRYSQSMKFNNVFRDLMRDESLNQTNDPSIESTTSKTPSLESLLLLSIKYAESVGDKKMAADNLGSLETLRNMRAGWLQSFDEAMRKRKLFGEEKNQHLALRAAKFGSQLDEKSIALEKPEKATNTPKHEAAHENTTKLIMQDDIEQYKSSFIDDEPARRLPDDDDDVFKYR